MSAGSRVAHTFELLESILLMLAGNDDLCTPDFRERHDHDDICVSDFREFYNYDEARLRLRTVLLSQRVCKLFEQTIASSTRLQEALFFKIKASRTDKWHPGQQNSLTPAKRRPCGTLKLSFDSWNATCEYYAQPEPGDPRAFIQRAPDMRRVYMRICHRKNKGSVLQFNSEVKPSWVRMHWRNAPFTIVELRGYGFNHKNEHFLTEFLEENRDSPTLGVLYDAVHG
ncbi:hypothetical protein HII31_01967 [Pseudocercospora fuligena]|uniref:Uncharacterized protein n=1 Tax=Pseudocercospora fuligena TaxID=685502 RepID=A0A8H6RTJ1_9PEZI|nr:hypothetical protein HII31_01967 [Pseudocercospora fuligena]